MNKNLNGMSAEAKEFLSDAIMESTKIGFKCINGLDEKEQRLPTDLFLSVSSEIELDF
jgi:hypothetical protein